MEADLIFSGTSPSRKSFWCDACQDSLESISIYHPLLKFECEHEICYSCFQKIRQEMKCTDRATKCCLCPLPVNLKPISTPKCFIMKISNIPWEVSIKDLIAFLGYSGPMHRIHIPIDKLTGKTRNFVFMECSDLDELERMIRQTDGVIFKSRVLASKQSNLTELTGTHFDHANEEIGQYLTREEINNILNVCRNYKLHFSRKCAERPYEHIISLLRLVPWQNMSVIARDHFFELCKLAVESLKVHLAKVSSPLKPEVLESIIDAVVTFPIFTEKQKSSFKETCRIKDGPKVQLMFMNGNDDEELNEIKALKERVAALTIELEEVKKENVSLKKSNS